MLRPVTSVALTLVGLIAFFVALIVCMEAGRRAGRKAFGEGNRTPPAGLGTVETVAFGLLGLLLAFTFSGAAARLDARRTQIVDEANAIGTAWLRIDTVPPSAQPKLRDGLRKYADSRIAVYRTFSQEGLDAARGEYARSTGLQNEIWA